MSNGCKAGTSNSPALVDGPGSVTLERICRGGDSTTKTGNIGYGCSRGLRIHLTLVRGSRFGESTRLISVESLVNGFKKIGLNDEAIEQWTQALALARPGRFRASEVLAPNKERSYQRELCNNIGVVFTMQHKYDEAEPYFLEVITLLKYLKYMETSEYQQLATKRYNHSDNQTLRILGQTRRSAEVSRHAA